MRSNWQLRPELDFLNHGSFGATPSCVLATQRALQDELERDPLRFLAPERELEPKLDAVRNRMGKLLNADFGSLVMIRSSTDGVNAVLRSFPLQRGDEVLVTNHGYNACNNVVSYACDRAGAKVTTANFSFPLQSSEPVVAAVTAAISDRTRLMVIDHVTSATGLVLPVEAITRIAQARGVRVLIDGAHAPGMLPLDLRAIGADYYVGNHHKWLCAPKASGFLAVDPRWHSEVEASVISHAWNRQRPGRSKFLAQFDWSGTYDPTPILCVPAAIDFLESLMDGGLNTLMNANRALAIAAREVLCNALDCEAPCPEDMLGSLVALPLPSNAIGANSESGQPAEVQSACEALQAELYKQHNFELPIYASPIDGRPLMRVSCQAYNSLDQFERLAQVLTSITNTARH